MAIFSSLSAAAELLLPRFCLVCGASGVQGGLCLLCRRVVGLATVRPGPVPGLELGDRVFAAGRYSGPLARCILGYKEELRTDVRPLLASALARSVEELYPGYPVVLLPLPSSTRSLVRRGFSPAADLGREAVRILVRQGRAVCLQEALVRPAEFRFRALAQKQAGRYERQRQVRGRMVLAPGYNLVGQPCILLDDVVTTGASLKEAWRVLEDAGVQVLGAATVAWVSREG